MDLQPEVEWNVARQSIERLERSQRELINKLIEVLNSNDREMQKRGEKVVKRLAPRGREAILTLARLQDHAIRSQRRRIEVLQIFWGRLEKPVLD